VLFHCRRRVFFDTGKLLSVFMLGSVATILSTLAAFKLMPLASLGYPYIPLPHTTTLLLCISPPPLPFAHVMFHHNFALTGVTWFDFARN
jgi:hypothetical protein